MIGAAPIEVVEYLQAVFNAVKIAFQVGFVEGRLHQQTIILIIINHDEHYFADCFVIHKGGLSGGVRFL
jgi:hypothetical protein